MLFWIFGPTLFIIFIENLFFTNNDIDCASYADDTIPTTVDKIFLKNVINVFKSLHENGLKNIKVSACDGPAALLKKRFYDT